MANRSADLAEDTTDNGETEAAAEILGADKRLEDLLAEILRAARTVSAERVVLGVNTPSIIKSLRCQTGLTTARTYMISRKRQ